MIKTNIEDFILQIEKGNYVQAHEVLEDDWHDLKKSGLKDEAKYIQALINGATALALLYIKKRLEPSQRIWEVYLRNKYLFDKIKLYEPAKYQYVQNLLETLYETKN